jgi:hypothetical protein
MKRGTMQINIDFQDEQNVSYVFNYKGLSHSGRTASLKQAIEEILEIITQSS